MPKTFVTGMFKTRAAAEAAVDAIIKRGYTRDDVSVLMSDATRNKEFAVQTRSHAADGAGIGGAVGGTIGAVLAAIVAGGKSHGLSGPRNCRGRADCRRARGRWRWRCHGRHRRRAHRRRHSGASSQSL